MPFSLAPLSSTDANAYDYANAFDYTQQPLTNAFHPVHTPLSERERRWIKQHPPTHTIPPSSATRGPQAFYAWLQCRRPPSGKSPCAIGQVSRLDPTSLATEDMQTLLPVFGDQDGYADTQVRRNKQLRSLKTVR
jgi:hypothetical protein